MFFLGAKAPKMFCLNYVRAEARTLQAEVRTLQVEARILQAAPLLERSGSELAEIGELFHQLFHAVVGEEHGELGVFAVAFALEHGSLTIF